MKQINKAQVQLSKAYTRKLTPDESGGYVATIQEFPGCVAEGDTADEALSNLEQSAEAWLKVAIANNYPIRDPITFEGCSGKIALRVPRGLHKQVTELAELEDCSINSLLVTAISQYVSGISCWNKFSDTIRGEMKSWMTEHFETQSSVMSGNTVIAYLNNSPAQISVMARGTTADGNFVMVPMTSKSLSNSFTS